MGLQRDRSSFRQAQEDGFGTRARNAAINATVDDVLVPLCSNLETRQQLANRGIYAGVEYKICSLELANAEQVPTIRGLGLESKQGVTALVQPAYPLRERLERNDWPVPVRLEEVPLWLSKAAYEAGTAVGTLALSSSVLVAAAIVAFFVRFVAVPTPSMVPALQPGNIVLVTRTIFPLTKPKVGDVVFFDAPSELDSAANRLAAEQQQQQSNNNLEISSPKGKQFLKRVVAAPGESVGVKQSEPYVRLSESEYRFDVIGPYARPEVFPESSWDRPASRLGPNEYFVAGDNGYRSVDSRVWGPLKGNCVVGTARWVLWPFQDFGPVKAGPISEVTKPN